MMIPVCGGREGGDLTRDETGWATASPRVSYSPSRHLMYWPTPASRLSRQAEREAGNGFAWWDKGG
jgi:hypothetical protein